MTCTASAPGKAILFGEHFVVHGVRAILGAINRRVVVTSSIMDEPVICIRSSLGNCRHGMDEPVRDPRLRPVDYLAKRTTSASPHVEGLCIDIHSEIPAGVGLGSSSATCVATAASLSGLSGMYNKDAICSMAIDAERTIFEDTSGADCTACTYGGLIQYGRDSGFERVPLRGDLELVISDSGVTHSTDTLVRRVAVFADEHPDAFGSMCRRESALINSVLQCLRENDLDSLGDAMRENQTYLCRLGISNDTLDEMITISDSICRGSKITGAGGGGCIIAVARGPANDAARLLGEKGLDSFAVRIDRAGLKTDIPHISP